MSDEPEGTVAVEASVSPSEDPEKVAAAVLEVVGGDAAVSKGGFRVRASSKDLKSLRVFREQLRDRRVRAAARRLMLREMKGSTVTLMVNRQAAAAGVIALCTSEEESPLGPIFLTIASPKIEAVIGWLTGYGTE